MAGTPGNLWLASISSLSVSSLFGSTIFFLFVVHPLSSVSISDPSLNMYGGMPSPISSGCMSSYGCRINQQFNLFLTFLPQLLRTMTATRMYPCVVWLLSCRVCVVWSLSCRVCVWRIHTCRDGDCCVKPETNRLLHTVIENKCFRPSVCPSATSSNLHRNRHGTDLVGILVATGF